MSGSYRRTAVALTVLVLIGSAWGCGSGANDRPETVPVQGQVLYQGQPVTQGTVTFMSPEGHVATGEIQSDGTYRLSTFEANDGAVPGTHNVGIVADDSDPTLMPGSSPGYRPPTDLVPKKYNNPQSSGLTAEVTPDRQDINFDLD